ncbi:MAG: choice-of-anchor R domain-containing protein [Actinomycetota bacterium]
MAAPTPNDDVASTGDAAPAATSSGTRALVAGVFVLATVVLTTAVLVFTARPADDDVDTSALTDTAVADEAGEADDVDTVAGPTTPTCDGLAVTVDLAVGATPTPGDDVILGTAGADLIDALAGNDVVCAEGGDDNILGGAGNDRIFGGDGNDVLSGNAGDDVLDGGPGDDFLDGNEGTDVCEGGGENEAGGDRLGPDCEASATAATEVAAGPPAAWAFYGNPWTMRSLADVGIEDERVSVRITAKYGGVMTGFRTYYKAAIGSQTAGPGSYSAGTGGTITVTLWPDDGNGFPDESGTPLAEIPPWAPSLVNGRPVGSQHDTFFKFSEWTTPPTIEAGGVYHVVFENLDPNPNTNFLSINNGYEVSGALERGPFGPQVADWGILRDTGEWLEWTTRAGRADGRYDPIFVAEMADGSSWGNGYMEMADQGTSIQRYRPVTDASIVRQMFTPTEDHVVDAVALHVFGDAATMEVELRTDDASLGSWPLAFTASGNDLGQWQTQEFDPITLEEGTTYYLSLRKTAGSGATTISVIRDGSAGGLTTNFPDGATWSDGEAQLSSNAGESWSNFSPADRADLAGLVFREQFS